MLRYRVLLLVCCLAIRRTRVAFDSSQALAEFRTQFVAPYKSVITIFASEVLKPLADVPVPEASDTVAIKNTFQTLVQAAQRFYSGLVPLNNVLTSHKAQLDAAIEAITAQRSGKERELELKQQVIAGVLTDCEMDAKQQELTVGQQQLNTAVQSVSSANENVARAEENVRQARQCVVEVGGWFGKIFNAACHIGNVVDSAKDDRTRAQQHRDTMQGNVARINALVVGLEAQRSGLMTDSQAIQAAIAGLKQEAESLRTETVRAAEVQGLMAGVVAHVAALLGPAGDLQAVLVRLGELTDSVVTPSVGGH